MVDTEDMIVEEGTEQDRNQDKEPETEKNSGESDQSKEVKEKAEDLIGNYKGLLEKEKEEQSPVEQLREILENWGMQFSQSTIRNSTFIINQNSKEIKKKKADQKDILGTMDDRKILEWGSEHYKDYIFAVFLAVCILDCQTYENILVMGEELHDVIGRKKDEEPSDMGICNYKSKIRETLGVIEYRDKVYVRGIEQETDFLCLPSHKQSGHYIRLFVKEFPGLKRLLGSYLAAKIFETCKNRRNYLVVGGCTEALANIGDEDVTFFNTRILPLFFEKRTDEADYCLAMLLKQIYLMGQNRKYVITCAEQWGRITNNPHYPLTVLYLCGMIKNQENFVWGVWETLLNVLVKEIESGAIFAVNSYYINLREFFRSGNKELSHYKGVIHAFYNKIKAAQKEGKREETDILGTLFLLLILNDYQDCDLSGTTKKKRRMLWVEMMEQLDRKTGQELVFLWKQALKHRQHPREGWNILRLYLDKYESWCEEDLEKLAFFFYQINEALGNDQAYSFLKKCMLKSWGKLLVAEKIYERIMEETEHGR